MANFTVMAKGLFFVFKINIFNFKEFLLFLGAFSKDIYMISYNGVGG